MPELILIRNLGQQEFLPVWQAMQQFTNSRVQDTPDELWQVEHPAVFTQGQAGRAEHVLAPGDIPVLAIDRGGQITYHGPGQVIIYTLLNIRRLELTIRQLVSRLEQAVIALLAELGILASTKPEAPGVYVADAKICALGLRIRRGCCYHGLALNVAMDLEPFQRIHPCGYPGLKVTQLQDLGISINKNRVAQLLIEQLVKQFGYLKTLTTTESYANTDQQT